MEKKKIFENKFNLALAGLGGLIIFLLIFRLGVYIGQRQADFSYRWGENYHQTFGGPKKGFMHDLEGRDFISGRGNVGQVIKIGENELIIKDPTETEKIIKLDAQTVIRRGHDTISLEQIKVDDRIVVLGLPQKDGGVLAKLIRLFDFNNPPPPPPPMELNYPKIK